MVCPLKSIFSHLGKEPTSFSPGMQEPSVEPTESHMKMGDPARSIAHAHPSPPSFLKSPKCLPKSRTAGPSLNIWSPRNSCYPPPSSWDSPKPCSALAPPSPLSGKFRFQENPAGETEMCMGKCREEKHTLRSTPEPAQTLEQFRWPADPPTPQGQGWASPGGEPETQR